MTGFDVHAGDLLSVRLSRGSADSGDSRDRDRAARFDRDCVKTLDLVFYQGDFRGTRVKRFVEGRDRAQLMLLPECLGDFVGEDNPVRVVDAFIEELDLAVLGFAGVVPEATGRPRAILPSRVEKPAFSRRCAGRSRQRGRGA
jgi:hypothetical protein